MVGRRLPNERLSSRRPGPNSAKLVLLSHVPQWRCRRLRARPTIPGPRTWTTAGCACALRFRIEMARMGYCCFNNHGHRHEEIQPCPSKLLTGWLINWRLTLDLIPSPSPRGARCPCSISRPASSPHSHRAAPRRVACTPTRCHSPSPTAHPRFETHLLVKPSAETHRARSPRSWTSLRRIPSRSIPSSASNVHKTTGLERAHLVHLPQELAAALALRGSDPNVRAKPARDHENDAALWPPQVLRRRNATVCYILLHYSSLTHF